MRPRVLILRAAGVNCDEETAFAFERFGARTEKVHINALKEGRKTLSDFDAMAIPGGFSYGDDIAGGRVLAVELLHHLRDSILDLIDRGGLVLGICNGFQVLVKMGLLPGLGARAGVQEVTLTDNTQNRYEDRWVTIEASAKRCVFVPEGTRLEVPIAHAEGRYVPLDAATHERIVAEDLVAFRYVDPGGGTDVSYPANPNGSVDAVAGLVDRTGRVLGLMPHPERAMFAVHHPAWTSRESPVEDRGDGALVFENAVRYLS